MMSSFTEKEIEYLRGQRLVAVFSTELTETDAAVDPYS
jgi:hypothetical protein